MNANHIRILAITTMVVDHVGIFLLPQYFFLRIIGRFSFPLFAWLIANGAEHTRSVRKYLLRLGAMAFVSQAPYLLAFRLTDPAYAAWNIFLTLFLGLAVIQVFRTGNNKIIAYCGAVFFSCIAILLKSSYGAAGVIAVIICYVFRKNVIAMTAAQFFMFAWFYVLPDGYFAVTAGHSIFAIEPLYLYQPLGAFALLLTRYYNGENGRSGKPFFYFFYPIHLLVIYGIYQLVH